MVDDAEKYAEADKERKNSIEAANRADSVVNDTEKALKEFESKLDKTEADSIREKITSMREVIAKSQAGEGTTTAQELKEKTDELQTASLTLFDKMHKARAEEGQQGQAGEQQQGQSGEGQAGEGQQPGGEEKKP